MENKKDNLDTIVSSVIDKYISRSVFGKKKYNNDLDRNDLNFNEWLIHLQEELMDATLYIEKLKKEYEYIDKIKNEKNNIDIDKIKKEI